MPGNRKTIAQGWVEVARMEPIMAIEGRDMSERDKKLLVGGWPSSARNRPRTSPPTV